MQLTMALNKVIVKVIIYCKKSNVLNKMVRPQVKLAADFSETNTQTNLKVKNHLNRLSDTLMLDRVAILRKVHNHF